MTADDYADLARLAEAAAPGPWLIRNEGQEVYTTALSDDLADTVAETLDTADAEFIAAANPATILRLIEAARRAKAERDVLAARLAAVEALADGPNALIHFEDLRAVLSAAPTDTTKETPDA